MADLLVRTVDHAVGKGCPVEGLPGGVLPVVLESGRMIMYCFSCSSVWCDHRVSRDAVASLYGAEDVVCSERIDLGAARRALCQDLIGLDDPAPQWWISSNAGQDPVPPADGFVVDHSAYSLSVGGCSVCELDRVFAWVTVSGRLVFRCPDRHENLTNSDGEVFPLWWVPDSEDSPVAVERFANAGDIAAIIAASGPRSPDDDELALFDVKWAILPRPE